MIDSHKYTGLEIAIIGMSCRFPLAPNWRVYWNNLINEIETVQFLTDQDLTDIGIDAQSARHNKFVGMKNTLDGKEMFDSVFFDYRPDEAALMNPAHRIFHECGWEALEDAGYDPLQYNGSIGVFAGAGDDLNWKGYSIIKNKEKNLDEFSLSYLNSQEYLSTLLSYKLGLKGPSCSVNTACSTSLVALNLACKSLLFGEANIALAGAVSLSTEKKVGYFYHEGSILSLDGHCRAFDKDATGTVSGEGAGVVVLKRLQDAISDNDHIYCVIKGSAINNDGSRKVGFAAPSGEGQIECIKIAQAFAGVEPDTIGYVEAHGTGTKIGDAIEIEALNLAFNSDKKNTCAIGSVKTNIGHLDTAAGIAGLIKAVLCLRYKQIPASLHFKEPNPDIDFGNGPFYVNTRLRKWESLDGKLLRAGVSSFGIGGTNSHVILEEAPESTPGNLIREYKLLTLSAKTESALIRYIDRIRKFLLDEPQINLSDMCHTLSMGRRGFDYRKSFVFTERENLMKQLENSRLPIVKIKEKISIVFMFPGQGSYYINMARDLYTYELKFKQQMDMGFDFLKTLTMQDFKSILFPLEQEEVLIDQTSYTQPLLFLVNYSLSRLLIHWGLEPEYMIGYSVGEYVAACISGVFSFEDGLRLMVKRGELMSIRDNGLMLSVGINEQEAGKYVNEKISIAAVNTHDQVLLAGELLEIKVLQAKLDYLKIPNILHHISKDFHCNMVDDIVKDFEEELKKVNFKELKLPFVSNLSGTFINKGQAFSPDYWVAQMRGTVKFYDGIKAILLDKKEVIFIEVGSGCMLSNFVSEAQSSAKEKSSCINLLRGPEETDNDMFHITNQLSRLWSLGVKINWKNYYRNENRRRISLPTYPFEPIKYPSEVDPFKNRVNSFLNANYIAGNRLKDCIYYSVWKQSVLIPTQKESPSKLYLFFSLGDSFCEKLELELRERGNNVVEILIGEKYQRISETKYAVNPCKVDNFERVFDQLQIKQSSFTDIIYLWGVKVNDEKMELIESNQSLHLVYLSLANIVKELSQRYCLKGKRITIVTNRLHKVLSIDQVNYSQSFLLGLFNVLPQEFPVTCCNIDIDLREEEQGLVKKLIEELNCNKSSSMYALRSDGSRWEQDYQKNSADIDPKHKGVIKPEGVYLVVGGLGNLGFVLAEYLIKEYNAKVVLTGRKQITENKDSNELNQELSLKRMQALRGLSKNVIYYSVDVANAVDFERLVIEVESSLGSINGVIHAAGNTNPNDFELIEDISFEKAQSMFYPKVKGIENIYEVFKNSQIDFVWIGSSLSAGIGGIRFSSYSAANLYMNYFVHCKNLPNWKCVCLSETLFIEDNILEEGQLHPKALKPAEVAELFEWSLWIKNIPVFWQSVRDMVLRMANVNTDKEQAKAGNNHVIKQDEKLAHPRRLLKDHIIPMNETEKNLTLIVENLFGIDDVGVEDNFFEIGGDSLKAMMLLRAIKKKFSINLSLKDFFKCQTIREMAEEIDNVIWFNADVKMNNEIII